MSALQDRWVGFGIFMALGCLYIWKARETFSSPSTGKCQARCFSRGFHTTCSKSWIVESVISLQIQLSKGPFNPVHRSRQYSTSSPQYLVHPHPASTCNTPSSTHQACTPRVSLATRFIVTPNQTYLTSVLIFTVSTSYNFFSASLICLLLLFTSHTNTSVLFSSIFFIALSVFNGFIMTLWWSRRGS